MNDDTKHGRQPALDPNQLAFKVTEAANVVRVSVKTIRRKIKDGSLPYSAIGSRQIIQRRDLLALLDASRRVGTRPVQVNGKSPRNSPRKKGVNKNVRVPKRSPVDSGSPQNPRTKI